MKRTANKSNYISLLLLAALLLALLPSGTARAAGRCYVKKSATGANSGASWTNAYTDLQDALADESCTEIWVAKGTYTTWTEDLINHPDDTFLESDTFQLKNGVAIYGGFAGTEGSGFDLDTRNFSANETILSGEVGKGHNSLHVVTSTAEGSSATLDGFTITGGYAYSENFSKLDASGAGLFNDSSSPTLSNLIFEGNQAKFYLNNSDDKIGGLGGGMYNEIGSPTLTNITFIDNTALFGGGIYNDSGSPKLTNVTFSGNITGSSEITGFGAGMYITDGSPTLTNVTFSGNTAGSLQAGGYGGGMQNYGTPRLTNVTFSGNTANHGGGMADPSGKSVITNTIFWGNTVTSEPEIYYNPFFPPTISYSVVQGGYADGTNIFTADPLLGMLGDYGGSTQTIPIQSGSSAIDMGDATKCPATDQRGQARVGVCDIGAFEYNPGGGGGRIIVRPWVIIASDGLYAERVRVDWTATAGASYYLVYRSESLDGPKLPTGGVRTTSLGGDDLWAVPGVTYYYWVRACTDSGCGEFYPYNYDTGWQGLAAPLITASDGTFPDKVQVRWPAVNGASSYLGYRAENLGGTQIPVNGYLTSFPGGDDLWTLPGVTYFYWVKACNGLNCGPLSAIETGWR